LKITVRISQLNQLRQANRSRLPPEEIQHHIFLTPEKR
jgi:hypothetical protein